MAGNAPPPNGPLPGQQALNAANAGFAPSLPATELCGFKLPSLAFALGFLLPPIQFPPPIPKFFLALGLDCASSNPINISAGIAPGGGRVSNQDPDPDLTLDQQTS